MAHRTSFEDGAMGVCWQSDSAETVVEIVQGIVFAFGKHEMAMTARPVRVPLVLCCGCCGWLERAG